MTFPRHFRLMLIAALASANLLVLGLTAYTLRQSHQLYLQRAEAMTQNVANAIDQSLSASVAKIDLALQTVVDEMQAQLRQGKLDIKAANSFLARHEARTPEIEAFRVSDDAGLILIGNGMNPKDRVTNGDRDYFLHHRDHTDNTLFITKPVWGRIAQRHIIIFARRYNRPDGTFAGVVHATVTLDNISRLLSRFDLGPNSTVIVRDQALGLIARHPVIADRPSGQVGNNDVSPEFRSVYASGVESAAFQTLNSSDGLARIFTFRRIGKTGMIVNAGVSTSAYMAYWKDSAYKSAALAVGFAIMSSLMGALLLRLLTRTALESTRNRVYLQNASDGIQIVDATGRLIEINDRLCSMLGYSRDELLNLTASDWARCWPDKSLASSALQNLMALRTPSTFDTQLRCKDGQLLDVEANFSSFDIGHDRHLYASVRDITERKAATERIEQLAFYDPLTTLPNRRLMMDRVNQALASSARHHRYGALMMIDMDNFKTLNDTQGHDIGDRFLVEVAARLRTCLREGDTAARLGGDEFVVMMEDLEGAAAAAMAAEVVGQKILKSLRQPYLLQNTGQDEGLAQRSHYGTASIGITLFVEHTVSVDELVKRADTAMYQAKSAGRNTLRFFDPEMQASVKARSALESDLRKALTDAQFLLHYQPQVDSSGQWFGAEALLRWKHPQRGLVPPGEFISLAEETGLILPLGLWVLETACTQLAAWAGKPGLENLTIAVNVSAHQFRQPDFVGQVLGVLARTGARARRLKLELTESLLVTHVEDVIAKMNLLKTHGVGFSLDDFGTGYSSLSYLKRLPLDQLKIDQGFVRDILVDPNDTAISRTIVALAESLGLQAIAEGVETQAQRDLLASQGCHAYQGYLFGRPLPIDQFEAALAKPDVAQL